MNLDRIRSAHNCLCSLSDQWFNLAGNIFTMPRDCIDIRNCLIEISQNVKKEYQSIGDEIFRLKDKLFMGSGAINPVVLGELIALLRFLCNSQGNNDFWDMVHPMIVGTSKKLFEDGHYANSAEDAYIEINSRVKKLYMIINPNVDRIPDGDSLMNAMFSPDNPMIKFSDISTDTGKNIQKGNMYLFKGAISALRNPKAHENIHLDCEECKQRLIFASLLMFNLDKGVVFTGIDEKK